MATPKKDPKDKLKTGRPSKYVQGFKAEIPELARKLSLLGATDKEMADVFGVSEQTLNNWKKAHPEFLEALNSGKQMADANVADRLIQRAMGYEHDEIDIRVVDKSIVMTPIRKIYPPDTTAAIFWLKNRQKAQWRDRIDTEITGKDGGPIETKELNANEQARRLIFALGLGVEQIAKEAKNK